MEKLLELINRYKGTNHPAPIAVGVRKSNALLFECGATGTPGYGGNCSLPWNNCSVDCDCSDCECYECYESSNS